MTTTSINHPEPTGSVECIATLLARLQDEVSALAGRDCDHTNQVKNLENDLEAYKVLCNELRHERDRLQIRVLYDEMLQTQPSEVQQPEEIEPRPEITKTPLESNRVVAIFDGNGTIFHQDNIVKGRKGGKEAVEILTSNILEYLNTTFGEREYQLWIKIFINKWGMMDAYEQDGSSTVVGSSLEAAFNNFIYGFNSSSDRVFMLDIGENREAAISRVRANLEEEMRIPQTLKVIFGGCINATHKEMVKSYLEEGENERVIMFSAHPNVTRDMYLPCLPDIPELFIPVRLGFTDEHSPDRIAGDDDFPQPVSDRKMERVFGDHLSPSSERMKALPCPQFYLTNQCSRLNGCGYAHDIKLSTKQLKGLQDVYSDIPCKSVQKDMPCKWGKACFYGHHCRRGKSCGFGRTGKCWFGGPKRHDGPPSDDESRSPIYVFRKYQK